MQVSPLYSRPTNTLHERNHFPTFPFHRVYSRSVNWRLARVFTPTKFVPCLLDCRKSFEFRVAVPCFNLLGPHDCWSGGTLRRLASEPALGQPEYVLNILRYSPCWRTASGPSGTDSASFVFRTFHLCSSHLHRRVLFLKRPVSYIYVRALGTCLRRRKQIRYWTTSSLFTWY